MLKSFSIKTNDKKIIDFLMEKFYEINIEDFFISHRNFKNYENIILHYTGDNLENFINRIANVLTTTTVIFYERSFLKKILEENYFYFSKPEQKDILKLYMNISNDYEYCILTEWINYIENNKTVIFEGFINFRLYNYINLINNNLDYVIKEYLVEKEYQDFTNLLQEYIFMSPSVIEKLHLIYSPNEYIFLNEDKEIITINSAEHIPKYMSDVTFSNNDYCLNTLLYFLPKNLYVHLLTPKDNFINTLENIFNKRVVFCKSCSICKKLKSN